jgi:hypothetical protein
VAGEAEFVDTAGEDGAGDVDEDVPLAAPETPPGVAAPATACGNGGTTEDGGVYGLANVIRFPKSFGPTPVPTSAGVDDTSIHALATAG